MICQIKCNSCSLKASFAVFQLRYFLGRKTATTDRGKEFTCYKVLEKDLKIDVYFADAYSSWQRGSNENGNGLLREFFPSVFW